MDLFRLVLVSVSSATSSPATNLVRLDSRAFQKYSPLDVFFPNHDDFSVKLVCELSAIRSVSSRRTAIKVGVINIEPLFSF